MLQVLRTTERGSTPQIKNDVALRHCVPYWQKWHVTKKACPVRKSFWIPGVLNKRDDCGFSK